MKIDLTFWLILALLTSVSANFLAFYYIRTLLGKLFFVGENLSDLTQMITSYRNHIKAVYSMEMFYGDETLQHLMDHTRSLHEVLDEFEDIYEIAVPPQEGEETETNQEETQEDAPKTIDEENVFYAGSRTSNN
tara:strand:+ start:132 stop:533 length:402 start_codon:yes stop_codon:yes gene_type:complete